ncbi:MAG: hypothetical protein ACYC5N_08250 [Endomicrobiales bacterium]
MKSEIGIVLVFAVLLGLAACGQGQQQAPQGGAEGAPEQQQLPGGATTQQMPGAAQGTTSQTGY